MLIQKYINNKSMDIKLLGHKFVSHTVWYGVKVSFIVTSWNFFCEIKSSHSSKPIRLRSNKLRPTSLSVRLEIQKILCFLSKLCLHIPYKFLPK